MPNSAARAFIISAKLSSVPAMPSASVIAASLPDWMIMPRSRSSTRTWLLSFRNIAEPCALAPPVSQAFCETVKRSSRWSFPAFSWSNTISAVISLAVDAGCIGWSAFFA